jgi:23S rRNA (cytidine1920-2'-O)/16S rRNA (cytidine1409-2'-O)-methyltransferase
MSGKRVRADVLLVERGLVDSRSRAQALIMAGQVSTDDRRIEKPGTQLPGDTPLFVKQPARFVSRGGDKLEHALTQFERHGLDVTGKRCVDVGASTGGFTDCLLQRGAARVVAVDVGYGQLHGKLQSDPRVVVRERTNARHLQPSDFDEPVDLVVVDASFIGIGKLVDAIARILAPGGDLVALIKPQFEAGKQAVDKSKGVIRDDAVRDAAIQGAIDDIAAAGFEILTSTDSPIRGPKGNLEHLVYARRR